MLKEIVTITETKDDKVKIKFIKKAACSCCKLTSLCGKGEEELMIDNCGFSLKPGDKIEVGIEEKQNLLASLIVFLLPGVIFLTSLLIFRQQGELVSFFLAIFALCVYYGGAKMLLKKEQKKFSLKILGKL